MPCVDYTYLILQALRWQIDIGIRRYQTIVCSLDYI